MLVLLEELSNLELPAEVTPALSTAREHWSGDELAGDPLLQAKLMCWSYVNALTPPDLSQSDGRRVRALLCVLEPDGDQEAASLTAEWFVDMLEGEPRAD